MDTDGHHADLSYGLSTHFPWIPQVLAFEDSMWLPIQEFLSTKTASLLGSYSLQGLPVSSDLWIYLWTNVDYKVDYKGSVPSLNQGYYWRASPALEGQ